jgi:small GTP-binding protein
VASNKCVHGELRAEAGEVIDDPVVVLHANETFADICLHGGAWVVQATIDLLSRNGFEVVQSMDAPDLAFAEVENDIERRVTAALPLATTELGVRALLAQIEAWRDFAPTQTDESRMAADRSLHWLLHPPTVAIVGAANAGKSTLANRLIGHDRSIVADMPGTTRDWVGERVDLQGLPILLADTPGIRATDDAIEHAAIVQSAQQIHAADCIVLVLDATRSLDGEQRALIERFPSSIRVVNKCDAPWAFDLNPVEAVRCVATRGEGVDELIREILARFNLKDLDLSKPRRW